MDVFGLHRYEYKSGKYINGIEQITWVERYGGGGEVTISGVPTEAFLSDLAIGTLISHTETLEIMVIESHKIDETRVKTKDEGIKVEIKGRSLYDVLMDGRRITTNTQEAWIPMWIDDISYYPMEWLLPSGNTWSHVVQLLTAFLTPPVGKSGQAQRVRNLEVTSDISRKEQPQKERVVKRLAALSTTVYDLLASVDFGLKLERPTSAHPDTIKMIVHGGVDRRFQIQFNWERDDLESAKYLWSDKNKFNAAYIIAEGRTIRIFPQNTEGIDLRETTIDATDWDITNSNGAGGTVSINTKIKTRGLDELAKMNKRLVLFEAKATKASRFRYGVDYKIGDIVQIVGRYGINQPMRVVEHALVKDPDGSSAIPTFAPIPDSIAIGG